VSLWFHPSKRQDRPDRLQSEVRSAVVVQTPELMSYDLEGNLVRDGRWVYSWDAENRLVRVMSWGGVDRRRVDWTYDALGRRVRQVRYVWTNGRWQVVEDLKLVSDPVLFGRHIAELNGTNGTLVRAYVWGLDLSESLDGASRVGGLSWVRLTGGPAAGVHFVTYDGNGNVWTLVSASAGTETARYEYGSFGEPLRLTGAAAGVNPFRFSTKRTEDGTGLVLYEYRAYSPALGRWLSRDPLEESGGANIYAALINARLRMLTWKAWRHMCDGLRLLRRAALQCPFPPTLCGARWSAQQSVLQRPAWKR
jgi:RHS repeat-associated protein